MKIIDMNANGDDRQEFDLANAEQVDAAMTHFNHLMSQGKFASVPEPGGQSGRKITEFDPTAETVIFRNQVVGG